MYEKKPRPVQFLTPRNLTVSLRPRKPIIDAIACCAWAASGHAAAAPPSSVMNLRRFMSLLSRPGEQGREHLEAERLGGSSVHWREIDYAAFLFLKPRLLVVADF